MILKKLIDEYCPDGVEYKTIKETCNVFTGGDVPSDYINGKEPSGEYVFPVFSNGTGENALYGFSKTFRIGQEAVTFSSIGTIGYPTIREAKFTPIIRLKVIIPKDSKTLMLKFLKYALEIATFPKQKSSVPNINTAMIHSIKIPIPPLPVQAEVVRVLDKFTLLKAELEAELEARIIQYEHYRDTLLDFSPKSPVSRPAILKKLIDEYCPEGVSYKMLGEISTEMYRGSGITRAQVTDYGTPCVRYGEIYTVYGTYFDKCVSFTNVDEINSPKWFSHGDILFAITGENVEEISKSTAYIGDDLCLAGGDLVVMKHKQNPKYLAYALSTVDAQRQKSKGKVKSKVVHSSVPDLKKLSIPIPPLPIQEAIVDILDRFEAIVHDIQDGLPAEIALRQKQYEYYRDKLLTFPTPM